MSGLEEALWGMLETGLCEGALRAGSKLPTERELVVEFGAPRSEVRRALHGLERDGLIERWVGRGTFVTDLARRRVAGAPLDTSPAEIMQARLLVEPGLASLAARVATAACLGHEAPDFSTFEARDTRFHRAVALAARNGLLTSVFDLLNTARNLPVWGTLKRRSSTAHLRRKFDHEHRQIVDALRERDPAAAAQAMRPRRCATTCTTLATACSDPPPIGPTRAEPNPHRLIHLIQF
jgi:DNA-binding FadR family transcriptional regulator